MFFLHPFILHLFLILDGAVWLWADLLLWRMGGKVRNRLLWLGWMAWMTWGVTLLTAHPDGLHNGTLILLGAALIYVWHLLFLPLFVLLLVVLTCYLSVGWLVSLSRRRKGVPADLSRRKFVGGMIAAAPVGTLLATAVSGAEFGEFRVRRIDVCLPSVPNGLDGFTITHLSDIHVGRFTSPRLMQRMTDQVNALGSDLIVMTGDLINYSLEALPQGIALLRQLRAPLGVFLCEGNHDLIEGTSLFRSSVRQAGLRLLIDEAETLRYRGSPICLIGTRWMGNLLAGRRPSDDSRLMTDLFSHSIAALRQPGVFNVMLTHHPHGWDAARLAQVDLTLSGHTHGGQIMADENWGLGSLLFRYWTGLYQAEDKALVVSNGVGNWFPLRINAPAEIVRITLRSGQAA